jgi:hypothetical protein
MSISLFQWVLSLAVSFAAMGPVQAIDRPEALQAPSWSEQALKRTPTPPPPSGPRPPKRPPQPRPEDATWSEIKARYGRRP